MANECTHLGEIKKVKPSGKGCKECLEMGDTWVHLRLCLICGHVGCCDSSKNKHATKHFHQASSDHSVVRAGRRLALVLYRRDLYRVATQSQPRGERQCKRDHSSFARQPEAWPIPSHRGMAGDPRYAAHVDADRRQDSPGAQPVRQPLVGGSALCERARADDIADSRRWRRIFEIEFDFIEHQLIVSDQRGRDEDVSSGAAHRGRFLR